MHCTSKAEGRHSTATVPAENLELKQGKMLKWKLKGKIKNELEIIVVIGCVEMTR